MNIHESWQVPDSDRQFLDIDWILKGWILHKTAQFELVIYADFIW